MIDFHCHILPKMDDGSHDLKESMALIHEERKQGIDTIVFTPHFYAQKDSVGHFLERRADRFQLLESEMKNNQITMRTYLGAEVYYFGGIGKAEMVSSLCIDETGILLLEMPFVQWTQAVLSDVKQLLKRGITVVLAHVERYFQFQKDMSVMNEVLSLDLIVQLNAGSILSGASLMDFAGRKKQKRCLALLQEERDVLLGTDTHNMTTRPPRMWEARDLILSKTGQETLDRIDGLGERLLAI